MKNIPNIYIVGGLLYGDEGKGTTIDSIVYEKNVSLVIRYNGGPQAMHHVVLPNNIVHCFSQFGSGSFHNNCKTLLSKYMVISPHTLLVEGDTLINEGIIDIYDKMFIDFDCAIVTPYHKCINRIYETLRGNESYGTTGMGVGITIDEFFSTYNELSPKDQFYNCEKKFICLKIRDLLDKKKLFCVLQELISEKIQQIRQIIKNYKDEKFEVFDPNYLELKKTEIKYDKEILAKANSIFLSFLNENTLDSLYNFYLEFASKLSKNFIDGVSLIESELSQSKNIVFEGAQGALLDRIHGIYPHITKSLCSIDNVIKILNPIKIEYNIISIGVLRCYSSRHGNGPFITENEYLNEKIIENHNKSSGWQGKFRIGPFDLVAANYGTQIFKTDFLSITCLDKLADCIEKHNCNIILNNGYIISCVDDKINLILKEKNLFEFEIINGHTIINKILIRNDVINYKNIELLTVLNNAKPFYLNSEEFKIEENIDGEILEKIKNKLKDYKTNTVDKIIFMLNIIQNVLKLKILIFSIGPTYKDKIWNEKY